MSRTTSDLEKRLLDWAATYGVFSLSGVTVASLIAIINEHAERQVAKARLDEQKLVAEWLMAGPEHVETIADFNRARRLKLGEVV